MQLSGTWQSPMALTCCHLSSVSWLTWTLPRQSTFSAAAQSQAAPQSGNSAAQQTLPPATWR